MSSIHTKSAIDLTKTPFQLHNILSYAGSEITFIRQAQLATEIFSWSPDGKCGRQIVSKIFPSRQNTKTESIQGDFCMKIFLLRNDRKNQIQCVKALKCHVVEMVFSPNRYLSWFGDLT